MENPVDSPENDAPKVARFVTIAIVALGAIGFSAKPIVAKLAYEVEKRPFYVTRDGLGKPIESLYG